MTTAIGTKEYEKNSLIDNYKIKAGDTIYTSLLHVSRSGMMRALNVFVMKDNQPLRITYAVAKTLGLTYSRKHDGLIMNGCGMDMGFQVVYELSHALFKGQTDRASDAGYALKHRWL